MRAGLVPGAEAQVSVVVTPEMTAEFEELGPVHPVYATWTMVRHMELACRKIILPYLESDEDALGHSISVTHLGASRSGERVTARARLLEIRGNRIICAVEAHNERGKIGEGTQVQVVLARSTLRELTDSSSIPVEDRRR